MCAVCGCGGDEAAVAHDHDHHGHDHHHDHDHGSAARQHGHESADLVKIERAVLAKNDRFAAENRGYFKGRGLYAVNLLSAPGAGKTALIEALARGGMKLAVVEADLATDRDAERVRAAGAKVVQVNTGTVCHLDAHMLGHALEDLDAEPGSMLVIENVGNLVCPALFDLGEDERVVVWSVTEGEDKPIKYPHMFARASAIVVSKIDLAPHTGFDEEAALAFARQVNPRVPIHFLSARTGEGVVDLAAHLSGRGHEARKGRAR